MKSAVILVFVVLMLPLPSSAQVFTLGSGASLSLGDGQLDLGCADLVVNGDLLAGTVGVLQANDFTIAAAGTVGGESATLNVGGSWLNDGSFSAGTGQVALNDDCNNSVITIAGSTTFNDLSIASSSGKLVEFEAAETTTVDGALAFAGVSGTLLQIRSTVASVAALLVANGSATANHVDVDDNDASGGTTIAVGPESVVGSNAMGWMAAPIVPVLPLVGVLVLATSLLGAGLRRLMAPGISSG